MMLVEIYNNHDLEEMLDSIEFHGLTEAEAFAESYNAQGEAFAVVVEE